MPLSVKAYHALGEMGLIPEQPLKTPRLRQRGREGVLVRGCAGPTDRSPSPTHWGPVCRTGHPRSRWPTHQRRCAGDFPGPGRPILDIRARQLPTLEFSRAAYFWLGILARTSLSVAAGILSTSSSMRACRSANSCLNTCPNFKSAWSLILKAPILVLRSPRRRSANFRSLVFNERRNCLPALLTRA